MASSPAVCRPARPSQAPTPFHSVRGFRTKPVLPADRLAARDDLGVPQMFYARAPPTEVEYLFGSWQTACSLCPLVLPVYIPP